MRTEATSRATRQRRCTLEPVIEPDREPQPFAGGDRLGYVHAESAPIDTQTRIDEPAIEPRDPARRQATGPVADEPCLTRIGKDHDVESLEPEEGRRRTLIVVPVFVLPWVVAPVELHVPAVFRLECQYAVARGHARIGKRRVRERGIARA